MAVGSLLMSLALCGGCALQSVTKPVEYVDELTATSVGALKEPIEFTPSVSTFPAHGMPGKRLSFAYLGPVEWDKAGAFKYGLWMHVAAGSNWAPADISSPGGVALVLDDETRVLVPLDAPQLGSAPYQPIAPWGQTAYFELTVKLLQLMASSKKLNLDVRGTDGSTVTFVPEGDTRAVLGEFLSARSLNGD